MNLYYNLPPRQRFAQRLVNQFNADENLWNSLAPRRLARRKLSRKLLPRRVLKRIELIEFTGKRPPIDCIAGTAP